MLTPRILLIAVSRSGIFAAQSRSSGFTLGRTPRGSRRGPGASSAPTWACDEARSSRSSRPMPTIAAASSASHGQTGAGRRFTQGRQDETHSDDEAVGGRALRNPAPARTAYAVPARRRTSDGDHAAKLDGPCRTSRRPSDHGAHPSMYCATPSARTWRCAKRRRRRSRISPGTRT
jgi:hypothetical protein